MTAKKAEITVTEFMRWSRYRSLRSAYEPIWLGLIQARKSETGKWLLDAESAEEYLRSMNRTATKEQVQMSA